MGNAFPGRFDIAAGCNAMSALFACPHFAVVVGQINTNKERGQRFWNASMSTFEIETRRDGLSDRHKVHCYIKQNLERRRQIHEHWCVESCWTTSEVHLAVAE